ncbi:uncharacterized protein LOC123311990 isoform X2 [Coccinella septempunctata]|uniref:uncharacterized protein LOC123311990 isoform X1 n=1 Tax=Coccinella septempunctata TaxID=41139 RepID=UPI001D067CD3|nr:uncharacterized protein LOC123311990 isoform X1 [Coccinella septempunctata]XP_044752087.1 uncharacterized protein LOC123311990 isoform X2 [Coccinella septempunctata]
MCCEMYRFVFLTLTIAVISAKDESEIKNLIGEPDYRQVRLHWETDKSVSPEKFEVKYCELQSWGPQRCRMQDVSQPDDNEIDYNENLLSYNADIKGLRMATTYSFEIRNSKDVREREDRSQGSGKNQNVIVIPTKGFSARATQCLSHASEIEVSTGPYFAGRIAVEAADGERCALDGDPKSPRDSYTLRINHDECGSKVNETTVATFVIVQENLPILTHSTRRFLVICSYQPETLTVRAGLSLPTNNKGQAQLSAVNVDDENDHVGRRGRNFRVGRAYSEPQALVKEKNGQLEYIPSNNIVPMFVMCLLSIAVLIGIVVTVYKISMRNQRCFDDVSVSGFSVSTVGSCSTLAGSIPERECSRISV